MDITGTFVTRLEDVLCKHRLLTGLSSVGVDLGAPTFWLFFGLALLVLVPLIDETVRRVALVGVNVSFAILCTGVRNAPVLGTLVLGAYLAVRAVAAKRLRIAAMVTAGTAVFVLFVIHKTHAFHVPVRLRLTLSALGFSYVALRMIDLLRAVAEERRPAPTLVDTISYLIPFHMLAAGPIQSYDEYCEQPAIVAKPDLRNTLGGVDRIVHGLFKKFVLAQALQTVFLTGFKVHGAYLLLESQIYYIWIYLDFSAYSDIAVGIGTLLGIATPENFNNPLIARNLIDFWERWHISLSLFIRRNLFIPIQVSLVRRTNGRALLVCASIAFSVSFVLCGLWHGVSLRFLMWGALHAGALVVTNLYKHGLQARIKKAGVKRYMAIRPIRWLATLLTFEFVAFSLVFIVYPFGGGW